MDKCIYYNNGTRVEVTIDDIKNMEDDINWRSISCGTLTEEFIREFKDKLDWYYVCYFSNLTEDFINEFKDKIQWYALSHNVNSKFNLSENFIRKYFWNSKFICMQDFIPSLLKKHKVSEKFLLDCINKFKNNSYYDIINIILKYQNISNEFKENLEDII